MAVWGRRALGRYVPAKTTDEVVAERIYESRYETAVDIPDAIELPLLTAFRGIGDQVSGTETTYISVKGRNVVVQWKSRTASPEIVSAEIKEIYDEVVASHSPLLLEAVVIGFASLAVGFAVYMVLTALYQIVSFIGAETTGMIVQMIFMMMIMVMLTSFIRSITERVRRRE